jgi:hypothetical protein
MSGVQFDPTLVDVFLQIPDDDLLSIRKAYPDALQQTA